MAFAVDANPTLRNCTNSQSIVYLTDLTNIYQEQDCLTTKIPQREGESRRGSAPTATPPPNESLPVAGALRAITTDQRPLNKEGGGGQTPVFSFKTLQPPQYLLNPDGSSETKKFTKKHLDFFYLFFFYLDVRIKNGAYPAR